MFIVCSVLLITIVKLKSDPNSITSAEENPLATKTSDPEDPSRFHISFEADHAEQKRLASENNKDGGVSGQFIVQYDVDSQNEAGDVQVTLLTFMNAHGNSC